jgi:hypothetical protein
MPIGWRESRAKARQSDSSVKRRLPLAGPALIACAAWGV